MTGWHDGRLHSSVLVSPGRERRRDRKSRKAAARRLLAADREARRAAAKGDGTFCAATGRDVSEGRVMERLLAGSVG